MLPPGRGYHAGGYRALAGLHLKIAKSAASALAAVAGAGRLCMACCLKQCCAGLCLDPVLNVLTTLRHGRRLRRGNGQEEVETWF